MKTGKQGQSLFEVVFAVGVIILVLTGVVALAVNSMGSRTRGYERKRASELGTKVIEGLIKEKNEDPLKFWKLAGAANQEDGDYPGYRYSLTFIDVGGTGECGEGQKCFATASVVVSWHGGGESLAFNRYFSRQ